MGYSSKRTQRKVRLKRIGISVLLLIFILLISGERALIRYGQWFSSSNPAAVGDVVIALGDGSGARADAAFKLLIQRRAKLLFTAGIPPETLLIVADKYAPNPSKIYWGGNTKNTFDEALRFRQVMTQYGITYHRIVLVSDPYHLRRSQWAFQTVLGSSVKIDTYAVPSAIPSDPHWWRNSRDRNWVRDETKKFAFYWVYYGLLGQRAPLSPKDLAKKPAK